MNKKKGKTVSFDAMVKFFMQNYNIPTKHDMEKLLVRIDQLEETIKELLSESGKSKSAGSKTPILASDKVIEIIKRSNDGVKFADIKNRTGFGEKKLRNIIFRLSKMDKIQRKSRGVYIIS